MPMSIRLGHENNKTPLMSLEKYDSMKNILIGTRETVNRDELQLMMSHPNQICYP